MIPYESSPGRICGFSALGREGVRVKDEMFIPVWPAHDKNFKGPIEGGLYGLSTITHLPHNRSVIAVDDWMLALQCQVRTLRSQRRPMPIVAWRDQGRYHTKRAWQSLEGRQVIFWGTELTVPILIQAVDTNGRIALLTWPDRNDQPALAQFLRDRGGGDIQRYIEKVARPWEDVLRCWLVRHRNSRNWLDFREQLQAAGGDLEYIVQQIRQPRLRQSLSIREISFGAKRVIEQSDRWILRTQPDKKTELLNCTLKITHVILDTADPEQTAYYYGRIAFDGQHIPFLERADAVREKTSAWLADTVARAGLGAVACLHAYRNDLHQIAIMFHSPVPISEPVVYWRRKLPKNEAKPYREARPYLQPSEAP